MKVPLKWLVLGIGLLNFAEIGSGSPPGRKIRLHKYEIQFGKWPLMEVTKLQKKPKNKWKGLNGFMKTAIQANAGQGLQNIQQLYGIPNNQNTNNNGPIVFVGNNGAPHLPPFKVENTNGSPLAPITFIDTNNSPVKFTPNGGSPPPPAPIKFNNIGGPPPFKFGNNGPPIKNQGPVFFASLSSPFAGPPGPKGLPGGPTPFNQQPVLVQSTPTQSQSASENQPKKSSLKSLISSVMGKAAYSGFFGPNGKYVSHHNNPDPSFPPGPPPGFGGPVIVQTRGPPVYKPSGPPSSFQSSGPPPFQSNSRPPMFQSSGPPPFQSSSPPQFGFQNSFNFDQPSHHVQSSPPMIMGDVASSPRFDMNKVPQVPPVIKIGHHPPEGYSMNHGEQQLITLKLPSTSNRRIDSEDLLSGAEYKYGDNIFRRQDDGSVHVPAKKHEKRLPDIGAIYTVNMVLQTPNISAPMNGSQSEHFKQGVEEMHRIYGNNNKQSPLDSQVKLLGKLFTELQRLKPTTKSSGGEKESNSFSVRDSHVSSWGNARSSNSRSDTYSKPKVDAPVMAVHIQTYSVPEPGSADSDVIESARTFGLQGHKFEFGNTNEIINLMDTAQKADISKIPLDELGNNRREVNQNLQDWIKAYVSLTRKINHEAHAKGESIANTSFRQHQMYMPAINNHGFSGFNVNVNSAPMQPMDPKMYSQGASITNAGAVATYRG